MHRTSSVALFGVATREAEIAFLRGLLGVTLFFVVLGLSDGVSFRDVSVAVVDFVGGKTSSLVFLGGKRGFPGPLDFFGNGDTS